VVNQFLGFLLLYLPSAASIFGLCMMFSDPDDRQWKTCLAYSCLAPLFVAAVCFGFILGIPLLEGR
jgi:hypothetical protein